MHIDPVCGPSIKKRGLRARELVPIVLIGAILLTPWLLVSVLQSRSPFYQNYDPEVQYFMNSLVALKGDTYYYLDHPGTPVEVIGSIVLALTYPFTSSASGGFIYYHLQNPNLFLHIVRLFLTISSLGCAIYMNPVLTTSPLEFTEALVGIAVPLMFYTIDPGAFATLTPWSHAPWYGTRTRSFERTRNLLAA